MKNTLSWAATLCLLSGLSFAGEPTAQITTVEEANAAINMAISVEEQTGVEQASVHLQAILTLPETTAEVKIAIANLLTNDIPMNVITDLHEANPDTFNRNVTARANEIRS
jgi:hypothetical protein